MLDPDSSCRKALSGVIAQRVCAGLQPPSQATGGYCKARQRLPEVVLRTLFLQTGHDLEARARPAHLWCGRTVTFADGTGLSAADTPANQAAYPQPASQQPGCGFPLLRMVALVSLATGALLDVALSAYSCGENILFRHLWASLAPGDVLAADRGFCSYANFCGLRALGVDCVARLNASRAVSFIIVTHLGPGDRLIYWPRPHAPAKGYTVAEWRALPEQILLRETHVCVEIPGWRTVHLTLLTTLLDARRYSPAALARLYRLRWHCELTLRDIKTTLGMEFLRARTPEMVRKEIYAYLLAYNLLRTLMAHAAQTQGTDPLRLSFQAARQHLETFAPLLSASTPATQLALVQCLLALIAGAVLPARPNRREPRCIKRRPKSFARLCCPRAQARRLSA